MLTARENFLETVKHGKPDRYVNQFEFMELVFNPTGLHNPTPKRGEIGVKNAWGVYNSFPEGVPASFPDHLDPAKILIKDIEEWKEVVKAPSLDFPQAEWDIFAKMVEDTDPRMASTAFIAPGLFEQTHHMCSMVEALMNYMTNPDEMHDLIKYLTDYEVRLAELVCEKMHPELLLHHDDWGSELQSFLRPEMFEEFFLEPYKAIYGTYHANGVKAVIHHSDSYGENLVPYMIEMGIDVWQGAMASNDIGAILEKYGDKICIMGGIDNKFVDFEGWTPEDCKKAAKDAIDKWGKYPSFIPCITQGGAGSVYPGAYDSLLDAIDEINKEKFGIDAAPLRAPTKIIF